MGKMRQAAKEAEEEMVAGETTTDDKTSEVTSSKETQQTEGQAESQETQPETSKTTEESFAKSFDPLKLSGELQPVYKSMQADYTRKTSELANLRKQTEDLLRFKPVLDKLVMNPELFNQVMGIETKSPSSQEPEIPDDPKEFADYLENKAVERMKREMAVDADIQTASQCDERLNDENFAKMVFGLVQDDAGVKNGTKSFTQATKEAIVAFDKYMAGVQSQAREQLVNQAKGKKLVTTKRSTPLSTSEGTIKSFRDAYKAALEEVGV